jgi:hypothetical protein
MGTPPTTCAACPRMQVSMIYVLLSFTTFFNLLNVQHLPAAGPGAKLDGVLTATLLSCILVVLLNIFAFFILARKTWVQSGTGFR